LLGHSQLETVALHSPVATKLRGIMSPLDRLTPMSPKKDEIKNENKENPALARAAAAGAAGGSIPRPPLFRFSI
jgi:hypothetical protein